MQGTRFRAHGLLQALACEAISTGRWQVRQAGKCDSFKLSPHEVLEALNLGTNARAGNTAASEDLHAMIRHLVLLAYMKVSASAGRPWPTRLFVSILFT